MSTTFGWRHFQRQLLLRSKKGALKMSTLKARIDKQIELNKESIEHLE